MHFDNIARMRDDALMHSKRNKLIAGLAWLLFWGLMVATAVQDYQRNAHDQALWKPVLWETSSMLVTTCLLLVQRHFTLRHDALLTAPWRWFARQALWLPLYWVAFVPLAFGIRHAVYALAGDVYRHDPWIPTFVYESIKISIFIGLFTVIRFGILSYHELLGAKLRAEQSNALLRQAQLQQLAQQMRPHFLFNALNTISSLMHSDVDKADATLVQLAEVLRATLDMGELHEAPLEAELRLARSYARVMQERFADRVDIGWDIGEAALGCTLPVMSLQPLLENVFKHTIERRSAATRISVSAVREHDALVVRVDDDAGTLAPGVAGGVGLNNLRERLAMLYGAKAGLVLSQLAPAGVRAELRLPCGS
jgi:two-component system LytT family sensor kinase